VDGVTAKITQPGEGLSNRSPKLTIAWDSAKLKIAGPDLAKLLLDTEPRIVLSGSTANSVSITPYMMMPGEDTVVGDRLYAALAKPPQLATPEPVSQAQPAAVAGQWDVRLEFGRGSASHNVVLEQDGGRLAGTHHAEFYSSDLNGTVEAKTVGFRSAFRVEGQGLSYAFTGTVDGDKMSGVVNLGEYGETTWTAQRHKYGRRGI
jgi:L-seryl-tRNA(Ser) seleniumtransferase